jgi:2-phospho-L-lactate guanylyltransferase
MEVVVPYRVADPKSRLAPTLDAGERETFARLMLADVLAAVEATGREPTVLATEPVDLEVTVRVDDRPLTDAVNGALPGAGGGEEPVAVVMADLALATPDALERLFRAAGEVVLVPGRGGGTNALLARDPAFHTDYHGASVRDHRRVCRDAGLTAGEVDSYRLGTDVDEPADLVEVLLHADGRAADWLADRFELDADGGRVGLRRR